MQEGQIALAVVAIIIAASFAGWLGSRFASARSSLPAACRSALQQRFGFFLSLGLMALLLATGGTMFLARLAVGSSNEEDVLAATLTLILWCIPGLVAAGFVMRRAWQRWRLLRAGTVLRGRPLRTLYKNGVNGRMACLVYEFEASNGGRLAGRSPRLPPALAEQIERRGWLEVVVDPSNPANNEINLDGL